jgi:hypothetical protein
MNSMCPPCISSNMKLRTVTELTRQLFVLDTMTQGFQVNNEIIREIVEVRLNFRISVSGAKKQ